MLTKIPESAHEELFKIEVITDSFSSLLDQA
jgi:hypothetical protein